MGQTGDRIRELRNLLGLSQEQLAEELEVSVKSIQRYETGKSRPDTYTLVKLATYFEVSADYLLGLTGLKAAQEERRGRKQYGTLYRAYLDCKNHGVIDESAEYYWITLDDGEHVGGHTVWAGWADEAQTVEIRKLRPVIPEAAAKLCTEVYERPMFVNRREDAELFRIFGGHAIVRTDICERHLPEFCTEYVVHRPCLTGAE